MHTKGFVSGLEEDFVQRQVRAKVKQESSLRFSVPAHLTSEHNTLWFKACQKYPFHTFCNVKNRCLLKISLVIVFGPISFCLMVWNISLLSLLPTGPINEFYKQLVFSAYVFYVIRVIFKGPMLFFNCVKLVRFQVTTRVLLHIRHICHAFSLKPHTAE